MSVSKEVRGCLAFAVWWVFAVFPAVPFLPIGRTAGSLLGACLMIVLEVISPDEAFEAVDLPILGLLFGTMVVSVHLERAELFKYLRHALSWKTRGGKDLLCRVCLLAALSSAVFTNDTTCVVLTGFVLEICRQKNLHPKPFLLALASSSNIGSAATPIGNPQNLVIAIQSGISFGRFLTGVLPGMVVGLVVNTSILLLVCGRSLIRDPGGTVCTQNKSTPVQENSRGEALQNVPQNGRVEVELRWISHYNPSESNSPTNGEITHVYIEQGEVVGSPVQNAKSIVESEIATGEVFRERPVDDIEAHAAASGVQSDGPTPLSSVMLFGRKCAAKTGRRCKRLRAFWMKHSRRIWKICVYLVTLGMLAALLAGLSLPWTAITAAVVLMVLDFSDAGPNLAKVSYSLLVFFSGMFIATAGFNATNAPEQFWSAVEPHAQISTASGVAVLSLVVTVLSNVASNVPTVLLLGPRVAASAAATPGASSEKAWLILAWVSTVAGNLTLVGSAANLIVCEQARPTPSDKALREERMNEGPAKYHLSFWNHLKFGFPSTLVVTAAGLVPFIRKF
ncbi:silicon efflux transporter LSI2 isoform X2 [Physcomitrium patens]|uniref:Citrate transporter-like domain-containing protein n=1 Tax=Physcomitrium patens TaxID=3218 RepID=A0A2K1JS67_PHYPA|nr:silicon efflux transporter LSI2-like isoform X2 [Physcomitrium patens]PNR44374.1 hypothetical protein PHYPA_016758 [Physcomitrium patens]|eukprot:XP_024390238.1 silicon efflux transporter LSI2-like isoform X2 [Physcomitrella patens]